MVAAITNGRRGFQGKYPKGVSESHVSVSKKSTLPQVTRKSTELLSYSHIAQYAAKTYGMGYNGQYVDFDVVGDASVQRDVSKGQIARRISEYKSRRNKGDQKLSLIVNLGKAHWVSVTLIEDKQNRKKAYVIYQDSFGSPIRSNVESQIRSIYPEAQIVSEKTTQQHNGYDCGRWSLANTYRTANIQNDEITRYITSQQKEQSNGYSAKRSWERMPKIMQGQETAIEVAKIDMVYLEKNINSILKQQDELSRKGLEKSAQMKKLEQDLSKALAEQDRLVSEIQKSQQNHGKVGRDSEHKSQVESDREMALRLQNQEYIRATPRPTYKKHGRTV
jgi:hypothetical protein